MDQNQKWGVRFQQKNGQKGEAEREKKVLWVWCRSK